MKISPRYDTDPIIRLDGEPNAIAVPLLRQRRRFAKTLSSLSPEQWAAPSRCAGWRVQDVVAHLTTTDQFWTFSATAGLAGTPSRLLADFDPKATPAAMVDAMRDASPADTLSTFLEMHESFCAVFEGLGDEGWETIAESPAGHVPISAIAHHALWDSWIHERDVLTPLGVAQDQEADEIRASLRYAAAIGPALALQSGTVRSGALALVVEHPTERVVVTVGDDVRVAEADPPEGAFVLTGDAVEVLDALSIRAPWRQPIPDEQAWLLAGLGEVFESAATLDSATTAADLR